MRIILNGQAQDLEAPATVQTLLESLQLPAARVAVQVNDDIVPRSRHDATPVEEGDRVEVIAFSSGG